MPHSSTLRLFLTTLPGCYSSCMSTISGFVFEKISGTDLTIVSFGIGSLTRNCLLQDIISTNNQGPLLMVYDAKSFFLSNTTFSNISFLLYTLDNSSDSGYPS
eukprot:TRINITY_DN13132_c0_g1_i1.p1 TRINITY_DN13132_c0_g1~~TRINITY_DN13132_c0_g1_i1.p1  ORF type:complete len:103 (-),score=10.34 TRINITY_DN13132_c0_g1_i1:289-597(-)